MTVSATDNRTSTPSDLTEFFEALALLRNILAEVRGLRADLVGSTKPKPLTTLNRADVVPLLAAAVAGRAFGAREVRQYADTVDAPLRAALDAAGMVTARRLGKWLQAIEGAMIGGVRLERIGVDNQGAVWIFRECADSHSHSHPARSLASDSSA